MKRRHGKVHVWVMVVLAVIAIGFYFWVSRSARYYRARFFEQKQQSVGLAQAAFEKVAGYREELGVPVDTIDDPNQTGLVGVQYSQLTYGRNDLSDVLTTVNPNFSAALVEMLVEAGVRTGDKVGFSWDGTYPGLNIQLLAVAKSMDLDPVIITAQSAGMWGANYPGLTWVDIEALLRQAGLWDYGSRYATLGGEADDGRGLSAEGRAVIAAACSSAGVECFVPGSFEDAVKRRLETLEQVRALVSVGRVVPDIGSPLARVPSRVIFKPTPRVDSGGVIAAMLENRIPVVYLGNPSRVAIDYGLPVAPVPLPEPGRGRLFRERRYSVVLAAVLAVVLMALLWLVVRYDIEWYLGDRRPRPDQEAV
ncbi:MAG: poly-gamma-glutamate system protein [candidate division WOR-3 bacterium]|nr:MAG: poly-gamma-glutamate system protein [candidate division WOR-3 bacterium]